MKYDYEKLECLRKERSKKYKEMWLEKDRYKKARLQFEIKILDIRITMEKMKQNNPQ